jgi:hypothetical protein
MNRLRLPIIPFIDGHTQPPLQPLAVQLLLQRNYPPAASGYGGTGVSQ